MLRALILSAALLAASPAVAETARQRMVVTAEQLVVLREAEPGTVVLHVGEPADYAAGHVPGARLLTLPEIAAPAALSNGLVLEMPTAEALHAKLTSLGVGDGTRIVVYPGKELQSATRVLFTLEAAGLGDRSRLLDGGLRAWTAAGGAVSTEAPPPARPGQLSPLSLKTRLADADTVRAAGSKPGVAVVDARATPFYAGERAGIGGAKGRIPGAKNLPFSALTEADGKLKPEAELRAAFAAAGVKPGDKVIAYCHVGQQASAVEFAARTLGHEAVIYDGSFQDWARRGLPVEADGSTVPPSP